MCKADKLFGGKLSHITDTDGGVSIVQSRKRLSKVTQFKDKQGAALAEMNHNVFNLGSTLQWGSDTYR